MSPPDRSRSMGLVLALVAGCLVMSGVLFAVLRSKLLTAYEEEVAPTTALAQLEYLGALVELYVEKHGRPPARLADLVPEYLEGLPVDPWGRSVLYASDPAAGTWTLRTLGADGREGGTGAASDLLRGPPE